jgi:hypothetical protein
MSELERGCRSMELPLASLAGLGVVLSFVVLDALVDVVEKVFREVEYLTLALWRVSEHYRKRMERSLISFVDVEEGVFVVVLPLLGSLLVFV